MAPSFALSKLGATIITTPKYTKVHMDTKEIKVLMVEPGKHPKVTTLKNDLNTLQKTVSI